MALWGHTTTNFSEYLKQYLWTATKGKVTAEFSAFQKRFKLKCNVCDISLTCPEPEGSALDYQAQEFVKIHAHTGGHCAHDWRQWDGVDGPTFKCIKCQKLWDSGNIAQPKPVTADFKPVVLPLSPAANVVIKNIKPPSGIIDDRPEMAEKIKAQMVAYENQIGLLDDEAMLKKVKQLQKAGELHLDQQQQILAGWQDFKAKGLATQEDVDKQQAVLQDLKIEQQALENQIKVAIIKEAIAQAEGKISGIHVGQAPAKAKIKKQVSGRKFR